MILQYNVGNSTHMQTTLKTTIKVDMNSGDNNIRFGDFTKEAGRKTRVLLQNNK